MVTFKSITYILSLIGTQFKLIKILSKNEIVNVLVVVNLVLIRDTEQFKSIFYRYIVI